MKNIVLMFAILFLGGCTTKEILPNLCYKDPWIGESETYVCGVMCNEDGSICIDMDNPKLDIEERLDDPVIGYTYHGHPITECDVWRNVDDPDAYMTCINNNQE